MYYEVNMCSTNKYLALFVQILVINRETDGPLKIEPDTITIVLLDKEPDPITIVLLNKEPDQIII